jgi:7,8-dihydro-6-hydroxymethylpterin-pyrophosphokinase
MAPGASIWIFFSLMIKSSICLVLQIPHPRLHERTFVLVPLADLAPEFRHPLTGQTVRQMLAELDAGDVKPYS